MSVLLKSGFNDLVFASRNQSFGAYFLRRIYSNNLFKGFLISSVLFTVLLSIPLIADLFGSKKKEVVQEIVEVNLEEIPPLDPAAPPPPPLPVTPPAPQISKVKFLPPEVKPDEQVVTEELPPSESQLQESTPGDLTQEGSKDGIEITAQAAPPVTEEPRKEEVYVFVPKMPEPKGGMNSFLHFIADNIQYPDKARAASVQGKVIVEFYVDTDGRLQNLKVIRSLGYGLDEEAIRVISLSPGWHPGMKDGRPVKVKQRIPILFELE